MGAPYVAVHAGVHKTATSHIQGILQRNAGRLRKGGVHYLHHRDTRREYTFPSQLNGYEKLGLNYRTKVPDDELAERARAFFEGVGAGPGERIVLSDENLPGHSGHCVRTGTLYNRRETLVPIFAANIPYPVREVHLAIRDYADFFASTFVEFLRSAKGENLVGEAQMKRGVISAMPSWTPFVALIARSFPEARVTVWRHEDFGALSERVIGGLAGPGVDPSRLERPSRARARPSASHRAVREILAQVRRHGAETALANRVAIQEAFPRGEENPGYDPWTPEERAHLGRLYARDCAEVAALGRVRFLAP